MAPKEIVVVDASVAVKWFSDEELTEEALEVRQSYIDDNLQIVVPDLILYELSNALRYNPKYDDGDVQKAYQSILDMEIDVLAPSNEVIQLAIEKAFELDMTVYDATYTALAEYLEATLLTTDDEIVETFSKAVNLQNYRPEK